MSSNKPPADEGARTCPANTVFLQRKGLGGFDVQRCGVQQEDKRVTGALCPQTQPPLRRSAASQLPSAPSAAAARGHLGRGAAEGSRGPVGARDGGEAAPPLNETASKHKSTSAAALRRVLWTFHHAPSPRRAALKGLLCCAVPHQHSRSDGNSSSSQSTHLFQQELDAGDVFLQAGIHERSQSVFVHSL